MSNPANRPEWQFHRYSTTRRHRLGSLHFRVASAEYIDVKYRGQVHDVINTFDRNGEPTIYDRADFLAHVDDYMADDGYIIDNFNNL